MVGGGWWCFVVLDCVASSTRLRAKRFGILQPPEFGSFINIAPWLLAIAMQKHALTHALTYML
jgi:hypothetical protein